MTERRRKRPGQLAKLIVDIATGEVEDREPTPEERGKDPAASAMGRKGGPGANQDHDAGANGPRSPAGQPRKDGPAARVSLLCQFFRAQMRQEKLTGGSCVRPNPGDPPRDR